MRHLSPAATLAALSWARTYIEERRAAVSTACEWVRSWRVARPPSTARRQRTIDAGAGACFGLYVRLGVRSGVCVSVRPGIGWKLERWRCASRVCGAECSISYHTICGLWGACRAAHGGTVSTRSSFCFSRTSTFSLVSPDRTRHAGWAHRAHRAHRHGEARRQPTPRSPQTALGSPVRTWRRRPIA